ncbi:MAG: hypothetical protein GC191_20410 [Azospirillum sp.]|nr:hypothetical protein [Azospirillum sp.]
MSRFTALWMLSCLCLSVCANGIARADEARCRVGFDVGSSGIRVGSQGSPATATVSIDYFADFWDDMRLDRTIGATIEALKTLPAKAGLPAGCIAVAGGYSIWRLILDHDGRAEAIALLLQIHDETGIPLFIMPQDVEGAYGYYAARQALGDRLRTPLILDLGGGSMQIAGAELSWGTALGQRVWRRLFCEAVKGVEAPICRPNPVGPTAVARTAQVLAPQIAEAKAALGASRAVTAVSTPVVKGVLPTLKYLAAKYRFSGVDDHSFSRAALETAVALLRDKTSPEIITVLDGCRENTDAPICTSRFVDSFVTDMLLVLALMDGLGLDQMEVAGAQINNVPGIIADQRPFDWAKHYRCYLARLNSQGVDAFKSDPATCPE